jgi:ribosomal protein S18 acetylase RimI-like enzyme
MEYSMRPMEIEDYDSLIALWSKIDGIVLTDTDEKGPMEAFLRRNPGLSLVEYCGDELAGAVLCSQDGRRGYMHHLAVRKEFRRRGIGSALVRECLSRLGQAGIRKCNIFLLPENEEAMAFWQHNGFDMLPHFDWMQALIKADG